MDVCIPRLESKTFARFTKFQMICTIVQTRGILIVLNVKFSVIDPEGLCRLQNMFETDLEKEGETYCVCQLNQIFSNSEAAILSSRTLSIAEYV